MPKQCLAKDGSDAGSARDLNLNITRSDPDRELDQLAEILTASLTDVDNLNGLALIRAANLARAVAQGPMIDLMEAAVRNAPDDSAVLDVGAEDC